jgi:hypothetical protein
MIKQDLAGQLSMCKFGRIKHDQNNVRRTHVMFVSELMQNHLQFLLSYFRDTTTQKHNRKKTRLQSTRNVPPVQWDRRGRAYHHYSCEF